MQRDYFAIDTNQLWFCKLILGTKAVINQNLTVKYVACLGSKPLKKFISLGEFTQKHKPT